MTNQQIEACRISSKRSRNLYENEWRRACFLSHYDHSNLLHADLFRVVYCRTQLERNVCKSPNTSKCYKVLFVLFFMFVCMFDPPPPLPPHPDQLRNVPENEPEWICFALTLWHSAKVKVFEKTDEESGAFKHGRYERILQQSISIVSVFAAYKRQTD